MAATTRSPQCADNEPSIASARWRWICAIALLAAGVAGYANSFAGVFLFDDQFNIFDNARVQSLWPPVWLRGQRPLVNLTLAINLALNGSSVWGYHFVNLATHLLAGLLLFGVVRRTAVLRLSEKHAIAFAFAVSLIWLVHPLQTQSVTYIIQRASALMGLGYLLILYAAIRAADAPRRGSRIGWSGVAVAALAFALAAKPVAVTAPVMVILYDYARRRDAKSERLRWRWGLYAALCGFTLIVVAFGSLRYVFSADGSTAGEGAVKTVGIGAGGISSWDYLCTQASVITHYLRLAFWPHPLVLDYGWPIRHGIGDILPQGLLILALLIATVFAWRQYPWLGFAGAWFFITLAPTSSVIPIVDPAFEHRMYLPLAGVIVVLAIGVTGIVKKLSQRLHAPDLELRTPLAVLILAIACALGGRTIARNSDYHDAVAFWEDNARNRPTNPRAYNNLCQAANDAGKNGVAELACNDALRLNPDYADAHNNLANVLLAQGRTGEAAEACRAALASRADFADAHVTLGYALYLLGDYARAVTHERRALELDADNILALNNLGNALARQGDNPGALAAFGRALTIAPNDAQTHNNLAWVYASTGDLAQAAEHFEKAVAADGQLFAAWFNLAQIDERLQRNDRAKEAYSVALRLAEEQGHADQITVIRNRIEALAHPATASGDHEDSSR